MQKLIKILITNGLFHSTSNNVGKIVDNHVFYSILGKSIKLCN